MPEKNLKLKTKNSKTNIKKESTKTLKQVDVKQKNVKVKAVEAKKPEQKRTENKKVKGIVTDVYNIKGKVVETIELPKEIFAAKINPQLVAQAVRVYLANQRTGTASTKTRGEVKGSSRKIYKQKGTGRARHGSIRAPIFVHGGIVFGPKPRDYSLKMPQKMRRAALFSALTEKYKNGQIKVVEGFEKITPKTKSAVEVLHNLGFNKKKNILLVLPGKVENIVRAARNIDGVDITMANQLNAHEVLLNRDMLFTQNSIEALRTLIEGGK